MRATVLVGLGMMACGTLGPRAHAAEPNEPAEDSEAEASSCPSARSVNELLLQMQRAEQAFSELEVEAFQVASAEMKAILPCLNEDLTRPIAAKVLRYHGMSAFVDQSPELAEQYFASARLVEPAYRFPDWLVPEGNPLQAAYDAVDTTTLEPTSILAPRYGRIQLNGELTLYRQATLPTVVQLFDNDGAVMSTEMVPPLGELPAYEPLPPGMTSSVTYDATRLSPRRLRRIGLAGAFATAGITTYALALSARSQYKNPGSIDDIGELDALNRRANALGATGIGLGVAAAGFGVAAVRVNF